MAALPDPPTPSALTTFLTTTPLSTAHPEPYQHLALQIQHNLCYQHQWTDLKLHDHSPLTSVPLPRPLLSGLPPKRLYLHPDEQIALLKAHKASGREGPLELAAEREWVLPTHLRESWSLRRLAEVFDAVETFPSAALGQQSAGDDGGSQAEWRKVKRLVLATLDDDSTITYYIVHDGLVKPRQN